jgi:hypothetical protein
MPDRERAEDCPEDLSFQSFTQHATLFLPRFNTEFVVSVFSSAGGQEPSWFVPEWPANISTREPVRGGANLESGILSKLHRDVAQTGEPDGCARAAHRRSQKRAMGLAKLIFGAFALTAGAAGLAVHGTGRGQTAGNSGTSVTPRVERVPPSLQPDVTTSLQPATTTGAVNIPWLDALNTPPVDRVAINNNNVGTLEIPLAGTKRPAGPAGESGGKGGD